MKIIILESEENIINELKVLLNQYNFDISFYHSLNKLKEDISKNIPDLIITNAEFLHLVKWIKKVLKDKKIPIIAYHHSPDKQILTVAKSLKISSFMLYPFKKEEFLRRIFKLLGIKDINELSKKNSKEKDKIVNEISKRIEKLPPFPAVIREIEMLINSKKSSASDFEDVIKKDQVITAKVLKIVNSPFFSLNRKISTITESVAYMGYDTLRSVVYSAYTSKLLNTSLPSYGYKKNELWKHSYYTACFAKEISSYLKFEQKNQEEIFIGGLLHDIGKLIIGTLAGEQKIKFYKNENGHISIIEIEEKYFHLNHQDVGKMIAEKWNLPEIHKEIIKNHHLTEENNNNLDRVAVANLADFISKSFLNIEISDYDVSKKHEALKILNLEEAEFDKIYEKCKNFTEKIDIGFS